MSDAPMIHLFTNRGTLCGAPSRPRWQTAEWAVSCPACRAMIGVDPLRIDPPTHAAPPPARGAPARVRMVISAGVTRGLGPKKVLLS